MWKHLIVCAESGRRWPGTQSGGEALGPVASPGAVESEDAQAQEVADAAPVPAPGRTRRALVDRTYVAETANWTTFAERLVATCARLGVYDAERIFFVSDGAAAIRWIRERSFPTAIELLDWYHLVEQLKRGIGLAYPNVLEQALGAAQPGDVDRLLATSRATRRCSPARTSSWRSGPRPPSATWPATGAPSPTIGSSHWPARGRPSPRSGYPPRPPSGARRG